MSKWDTIGLDKNKKPRLDYKNRDQLSDELKDTFDSIVSSKRGVGTLSNGALPGPFNAWMYTDAEMADALDKIGVAIRLNTKNAPADMKAIAICTVAVYYKSNVEFWAHSQTALANGISQDILNDLLAEKDPSFEKTDSGNRLKFAYFFAKEYLATHRVSDTIYNETLDIIGSKEGITEFILAISHYIGLAAQLNILRVPNPGDKQFFG